jgi:hypothetical protein
MKTFLYNNRFKIIYVAVIAVMIFFNYFLYHKIDILKNEKAESDQNYQAATDNIRKMKTHSDSVEYDKTVYIAKAVELVKLNKQLSDELTAEGQDTKFLANVTAGITGDTVYMPGQVVTIVKTVDKKPDSTLRFNFAYNKVYTAGSRSLAGFTTYDPTLKSSATTLTQDDLSLNLVTGLKKDPKYGYEIFVRSDYPGFSINKLDGAIVDPSIIENATKKHWIIGPSAGAQWDLSTGKVRPYIGVGVTYSLLSF